MRQSFYLGTLELTFDVGCSLDVQEFNRRFLHPALPATARTEIRAEPVKRLDVPFAVSDQQKRVEWRENGVDCCAMEQQGRWLSVSRLHPDGNVTILVEEARFALFRASFRPWYQIHLEKLMLRNQALILHAASIEYRGGTILFTAPSGTGKTTQTDLWHRHMDGVTDLNGDRTLLQRTGDGWFACGFPVYGSSFRCEQKALPITAIVIVRRGETDRVVELSPMQRFTQLYSELTAPSGACYVSQTMDLTEALIAQTRVIQLDCTMKPEAVNTLYRALYAQEGENANGAV